MDKKFSKFKQNLNYIYKNNKIYREKMQSINITPDDIKTKKDISKLPLTTKEDFFKEYPNGWTSLNNIKIKQYHASSGTTGKPLIVGMTENDIKFREESIKKSARFAGIKKNDTVQLCIGLGMFTGGLSFYDGLKDLGCTVIPTGTMSTKMQLYYMKTLRPTVIISSASQIMHLYEASKIYGIDVKDLPIRIIRVGSELMTEKMRRKIKEAYGEKVSVTQDYGMTETFGPGLGMECIYELGMHLNDDYYFELIDPKTKKVTTKDVGELVVTTIYNEGFPIIRYCTNDIVKITTEPCSCGRKSPRIVKFLGRADDMLKVKGVKIFVSQIEDFIYAHPSFNHQYEIVITKENYKDILTINIEYKEKITTKINQELNKYVEQIEDEFKSKFGISSKINIVDAKTIKRLPGKPKRVRDLRKDKISV